MLRKINIMNYKWEDGREFFISPVTGKSGGNAYGYKTGMELAVRALKLLKWEQDVNSRVLFHYVFPDQFRYIPRKVNVLFSMWETMDLPYDMISAFAQADYIIVPSDNTKKAIEGRGVTTPVYVCNHGVDTKFYAYKERTVRPKCLQFLWIGAPNLRKGYDILTKAWYELFKGNDKPALLYMKSTKFKGEGELQTWPKFKTIMDTRNLTREDLRQLYWDSDAFLYPSRGEGAGLPPLEAMSTGLPVLAPPWTGMADYMDPKHSYPLKYSLLEAEYGGLTEIAEVDLDYFKDKINSVFCLWHVSQELGKKASVFVNRYFSLRAFGKRLDKILLEIKEKEGV